MLDTRLSSIFELMLDQAPWASSDTLGYSTLERPGAISVIFFSGRSPKDFRFVTGGDWFLADGPFLRIRKMRLEPRATCHRVNPAKKTFSQDRRPNQWTDTTQAL